tara:strand:- start:3137 stop:5272 length:2136 start_codon:yes stop_codon:yes gene_type:complete
MSTFTSPADATAGSLARAAQLNVLDANVATAFGLLPTNAQIDTGTIQYAVDSGAADAYVVTTNQTETAYTDGMLVAMKPANTNTGASTIDVDSIGTRDIKTATGAALAAGDVRVGIPLEMRYSSTTGDFHITSSAITPTTLVTVPLGGTGVITLADGGLMIGNGTSAIEVVAAGTTAQILVGGGASTAPVWGTDIPTAVTIGSAYVYRAAGTDIPVTDGGTGLSTLTTAYGLLAAGTTATGTVQTLAAGATTEILVGAGAGALPAWGTDLPTAVTIGSAYVYRVGGTDVSVADGGTGASTATAGFDALSPMTTAGDIIYGGASGTVTRLAAGAEGTLLMGNGAAAPSWLAAGTAGYFLLANGAADPVWTDQPTLASIEGLTIAAGVLIYGTGADATAALAAGATTEILVGGGAAAPVWTTATGTGAPVRAGTPTLTTPVIGAATGTSLAATTFLSVGADPADAGAIRLANAAVIAFEDGTEATITHVDDTGFSINLALDVVGALTAGTIASDAGVSGTTGTFSDVLSVDDTTDSTSGTSGSIHTDGGLGVAKTIYVGTGINFPDTQSSQADANTLDDYEEGTFGGSGANGAVVAATGSITCGSSYTGAYTKIGRLVSISGAFTVSGVSGQTGSTSIVLPFAVAGGAQFLSEGTVAVSGVDFTADYLTLRLDQSSSSGLILEVVDNSGVSVLPASGVSVSDIVSFSGTYFTS